MNTLAAKLSTSPPAFVCIKSSIVNNGWGDERADKKFEFNEKYTLSKIS